MSYRFTRRTILSASAAAIPAVAAANYGLASARQDTATPAASPVAGSSAHLLVADAEAATVSFYALPGLELTGTLGDIVLDKHNGVITLPDGRILFGDDTAGELVAVTLDDAGVPTIADRVTLEIGNGLSWCSVDPAFRYYAVTAGGEGVTTRALNIVDLETFTNTVIEIEILAEEELEAVIAGDPLTVYVSQGGQVSSHALDDLVAGNLEPTATVAIELGSHGPVLDTANGRLLVSTTTGFEVIGLGDGAAEYDTLIPWDVDGFTGGQNYRPRLGFDGGYVFGVLTPVDGAPEDWATVDVSAHITDLSADSATRVALSKGQYAGRWGISPSLALFAGHDGVDGAAHLFDVDPSSDTFGTIVGSIPIDLPTTAAVPGEAIDANEGYLTAISGDGSLGFVVQGGDGMITVIDTANRSIAGTIETAGAMVGAGYLTVVGSGIVPVDLVGR